MNLTQVNLYWKEYKDRYGITDDVEIAEVRFDTPNDIEGCFDMLELLEGKYILHLNQRFHIYSENYIRFILFHEFTHFYDFLHCPYETKEELFSYMNAYSEYHACRVTLSRSIEQLSIYAKLSSKTGLDVDKIQIPGPFREISIRNLLEMTLGHAKYLIDRFFDDYQINDFANGFRVMMYLFGYLSLFDYDELLVGQTLVALHLEDPAFVALYKALKGKDYDTVIHLHRDIANHAILIYLRASFRRFYPREILPDEEINNITQENFRDYIKELDQRMKDAGLMPDVEEYDDDSYYEEGKAAYRSMDQKIDDELRRVFRIIQ